MTGRTGYTAPTNDSPFTPPADITAVYEHFDPLVGSSVEAVTDLPSSGNWSGRTVFVSANGSIQVWNGTAWQVVHQPPTIFTPSVTGITVGSGGSVLYSIYTVASGILDVRVAWQLGSSGFTVGDIVLAPPVAIRSGSADLAPLGTVLFVDSSAGPDGRRQGLVLQSGSSLRAMFSQVSGTGINTSATTATAPFTWAAGDQILMDARYPI